MWPNLQFPADLVTFTDEILDGKLHFLCTAQSFIFFNAWAFCDLKMPGGLYNQNPCELFRLSILRWGEEINPLLPFLKLVSIMLEI